MMEFSVTNTPEGVSVCRPGEAAEMVAIILSCLRPPSPETPDGEEQGRNHPNGVFIITQYAMQGAETNVREIFESPREKVRVPACSNNGYSRIYCHQTNCHLKLLYLQNHFLQVEAQSISTSTGTAFSGLLEVSRCPGKMIVPEGWVSHLRLLVSWHLAPSPHTILLDLW